MDELHYLVAFEDIVHIFECINRLIGTQIEDWAPHALTLVIESFAFKAFYYQKVSSTGYTSYKHSFKYLLEKAFIPLMNEHLFVKKMEDCFKKAPFNVGFGCYLYLERNNAVSIF